MIRLPVVVTQGALRGRVAAGVCDLVTCLFRFCDPYVRHLRNPWFGRLTLAIALVLFNAGCRSKTSQASDRPSKKVQGASSRPAQGNPPAESQEDAIQGYINALSDAETQAKASQSLIAVGTPAIDPLIKLLRTSQSRLVREAAAQTLAEFDDDRVDQALSEALEMPDPRLATAAYRWVIRRGRPGTEPSLVTALNLYGRLSMAEDFIASGNPILQTAAREWIPKTGRFPGTRTSTAEIIPWGGIDSKVKPTMVFHFDGSLASTSGVNPTESKDVSFMPGKWGAALSVGPKGVLKYPLSDNLDFQNGTIEMWVSPRFNGNDPEFAKLNHPLLLYHTVTGDDQFLVSQSTYGGFYSGSVVKHEFRGAGGGDISKWKAGDWHHIAFTYSFKPSHQRFYIDGSMIIEQTVPMPPPDRSGAAFTIGCDDYGVTPGFLVDEVQIYKGERSRRGVIADSTARRPLEDR